MPELPEVETIKRVLQKKIVDDHLVSLTIRRSDLRFPIPENLASRLVHQKVKKILRRSKYLLIWFEDDVLLMIHLGMSGRLFFTPQQTVLNKHDHVLFDFAHAGQLRFRDPRRFGLIDLLTHSSMDQHKLLANLGMEPLDESFTGDYLYSLTCRSYSPIKTLIMNANRVVGVGNIYASEALFLSGIHPQRLACHVKKQEAHKLVLAIKRVLNESILSGGTSFRDYVMPDEQPGLHQVYLAVYGRENEPCKECKKLILRIVMSGRSTYFCSLCQK